MSQHERELSVESICTILTCTSEEFLGIYDDNDASTDALSEEALLNIIEPHRECLRAADLRYRLDDLLFAMLNHAPNQHGKRYVAVALHAAHKRGAAAVIDVARSWMEHLFLPMLTASTKATNTEINSRQFTIAARAQQTEAATQAIQNTLREQVSIREKNRCAITRVIDFDHVRELEKRNQHDQIPDGPQLIMAVAHIIPLTFNDLSENRDATLMRDMLMSWTNIDIKKLAGTKINSPENAIFMTADEYFSFGQFQLYFDEEAYPTAPNKYMVRAVRKSLWMTNGRNSADMEFGTRESGVAPPDPELLRAHAAFARVSHHCGADDYVYGLLNGTELGAQNSDELNQH